jgi:2-methylisocitrate lyase-like PEP mutase family enzyme
MSDDETKALCVQTHLPVNVLNREGPQAVPRLAALGVSRISHGPALFKAVKEAAAAFLPVG